jgi:polysaccharide deacetylase family protein (PEP-CTERM system associated)
MQSTAQSVDVCSSAPDRRSQKRHILTVGLDDYYHAAALEGCINRNQWYRFESRLEQNAMKTLQLLDRFNTKATFFVMGWVGERYPEVIREVARRGHEIASQGYCHRSVREMNAAEFREDVIQSRDILENTSGTKVIGNRCARPLSSPSDLWSLDVLAEEGYTYDSSLLPVFRSFHSQPWRRFAHRHRFGNKELLEFPFSTWNCFGLSVPIAGGAYFRQIPHTVMKQRVEHWDHSYDAPFVMYFHVSELDPDQPRIEAASVVATIRHYRKLGKLNWVLPEYLRSYQFTSVADYLGIVPQPIQEKAIARDRIPEINTVARIPGHRPTLQPRSAPRLPVTIVVPFFNEEKILSYFSNTINSVDEDLGKEYDLSFIFVDDGSTDKTLARLHQDFDRRSNCTVLHHERNMGVTRAILTGIRQASTEVICSIDCDCTYDPHDLRNFIPKLIDGVDMVTASPYHPQGAVLNVPSWRLSLSKAASFLYRRVLRNKLFTYTSCFRVYRRSAVVDLAVSEGGFLGVAEMLGRLDLRGSSIRECPATLEVRLLGRSKMKVLQTIFGHLGMMSRLLYIRLTSTTRRSPLVRQRAVAKVAVSMRPGQNNPK